MLVPVLKVIAVIIIFILPYLVTSPLNCDTPADEIYAHSGKTYNNSLARQEDCNRQRKPIFRATKDYFFMYMKDGWHFVSSPVRIDKRSAYWLGGILAVGGAIYAYDEELMNYLQRNRDKALPRLFLDVGDDIAPMGLVKNVNYTSAVAAVLGYLLNVKPLESVAVQIHEAALLGSFTRGFIVLAFRRALPSDNKGAYTFGYPGGKSFFSGHVTTAFETATIISHYADFWPVSLLCYAYASAMGLQRLDTDSHWPSDVYLGAVYGFVIGKTIIKLHESRRVHLRPQAMRDGWGMEVRYMF